MDGGHFNSFPMFSHKGDKFVWGSSRNARNPHDINIFIADWVGVLHEGWIHSYIKVIAYGWFHEMPLTPLTERENPNV